MFGLRKSMPFAATAAALMIASSAHGALLYSNNFDTAAQFGTGVTGSLTGAGLETASSGAWNAQGWAGNYAANRSTGNPASFTTLSLSNLAAHTTISGSFLLGLLESWDSLDGGCCAPDNLEVWIDGVQVASLTTNNALGTIENYAGGTELYEGVELNGTQYYSDTLVDMSTAGFLTFAHSASSLTLGLRASGGGWQGGGDEAFGLDSINLTYDARPGGGGAVPEPATWAMMISGFGLAGAALRQRRRFGGLA